MCVKAFPQAPSALLAALAVWDSGIRLTCVTWVLNLGICHSVSNSRVVTPISTDGGQIDCSVLMELNRLVWFSSSSLLDGAQIQLVHWWSSNSIGWSSFIGLFWWSTILIGSFWVTEVNSDWSTPIGQLWMVNSDWSTPIGQFWLIGQLWLVNSDWSTLIGQLWSFY